jgi:hypothetical protein
MLTHRAIIVDVDRGTASLDWGDSAAAQQPWTLRRSARARRLAARVHTDGRVEIVVPNGVSMPVVLTFVERHRSWIESKRAGRAHLRPPEPFPPPIVDLPALGEQWRVHLSAGSGRPRCLVLGEGLLSLQGRGDGQSWRALLRSWLCRHAAGALSRRLMELAERHEFRFSAVKVRRQRTRWGSCSSRGVISLNVCAVFQPPAVLDYLLVHELAHTRHMNHSSAYWACVGAACPDWATLDRQLNEGWRRVPAWIFA